MPIRILIFAGTIILLVAVFVFLVYIPKTDEISKIEKDISNLEQQLRIAKIKTRNLKKLEEEEAKVSEQFKEALKLLPDKKEIPSLLRSITQLGKESNLEFRLFNPQKERSKDFYVEIPVSIEVSGNYHNVAIFFDKVGRLDRIVNILDVSMKPEKPLSTNLITRCDALTFRFETKSGTEKEPQKKTKKR
jgi:type IV pilus assembly protein PilO